MCLTRSMHSLSIHNITNYESLYIYYMLWKITAQFEWLLISSHLSLPKPNLEKANSITEPVQNKECKCLMQHCLIQISLTDVRVQQGYCFWSQKRYSRSHSTKYKSNPSRSDFRRFSIFSITRNVGSTLSKLTPWIGY